MDEKPNRSPTIAVLGTVDPKALSIASEAVKSLGRISPKLVPLDRSVQSAQAAISAQVVESALRNLKASVMSEALKSFQMPRLVNASAFGEALRGIHSTPTFTFMKSLDGPNVTAETVEALRPSLTEAFRGLEVTPVFSAGVNEVLKDLARLPTFDVGPPFRVAVREAAVIADSPAVREQVGEVVVDLDDLSPAEQRALTTEVIHAIAALLVIVAILSENSQIALAGATLSFAALFVSIYWRLTGELDDG